MITCEMFMDYVYEEEVVMEGFHPLQAIKNQLRKICESLYKICNSKYTKYKDKYPKLASIFKVFADFFKRHSSLIDHAATKGELQKEKEEIDKASEKVKTIKEPIEFTDKDGTVHTFNSEKEMRDYINKHYSKREVGRERSNTSLIRDEDGNVSYSNKFSGKDKQYGLKNKKSGDLRIFDTREERDTEYAVGMYDPKKKR